MLNEILEFEAYVKSPNQKTKNPAKVINKQFQ